MEDGALLVVKSGIMAVLLSINAGKISSVITLLISYHYIKEGCNSIFNGTVNDQHDYVTESKEIIGLLSTPIEAVRS